MKSQELSPERKRLWYKSAEANDLFRHLRPISAIKLTKKLQGVYEGLPYAIPEDVDEGTRDANIMRRARSETNKVLKKKLEKLLNQSVLTFYSDDFLETRHQKLRTEGIDKNGSPEDSLAQPFYQKLFDWDKPKSTSIFRRKTGQIIDRYLYLTVKSLVVKSEWRKEHIRKFHRDPDTGKLASS